jgi:hypothetical protein
MVDTMSTTAYHMFGPTNEDGPSTKLCGEEWQTGDICTTDLEKITCVPCLKAEIKGESGKLSRIKHIAAGEWDAK